MSAPEYWSQSVAVLLVLSSLALLGTSRVATGIRVLAMQGVLLAVVILVALEDPIGFRAAALAAATLLLKGALFPWLLFRAQRAAQVQEELEPLIGYGFSVTAGVLALAAAVWLTHRLALPPEIDALLPAIGFFMILAGLLLLVSRRLAIGQVFGYVVLEHGIALFGLAVANHEPLVIELAILLDVFVAVFVMGIAIAHINREFDHIEVDRMAALRD
jgi:hydrogenase-4 component E